MNPLISIIIPVYKTEKYLRGSIHSALEQTYENIEIILVDDGSPDGSPDICDEFQEKYSNVSVIHKKNGGLSSARNAGIERASGRYILFLDSDDTLEKHAVSDMYKIIVDENSDAVYPNTYIKVFEKDASRVQATHFTNEMFSRDPKIFALDILIGKGRARRSTAVLYDLDVIRKNSIRYLNGRISEDFFFNLDYLSAASAISLYDKPSLNNLKREGSISSSYFESFFDTILEMDKCVDKFICSIDSNLYKANISGKRDSLLFRNLMIYVINVMGDKSTSYNKRVQKCIAMMKHQRFQEALSSRIEIPYFEGKIKRYYMKVLLQLVNIKMYHAGCMMAWIAAKLNTL